MSAAPATTPSDVGAPSVRAVPSAVPPPPDADPGQRSSLVRLVALEADIRRARNLGELRHLIVNRTRELIPCRQAILFDWRDGAPPRVVAASDVAAVERTAPYVAALDRMAREVAAGERAATIHTVEGPSPEPTPPSGRGQGSGASWLWIPLATPALGPRGVLCLATGVAPQDLARSLGEHLGLTYGHALHAMRPVGWLRRAAAVVRRTRTWLLAAALGGALLIPVRLSVLAPTEVIARDPAVITSPLAGAVKTILVEANQPVAHDDPLVELEDSELASRHELAARALAVAEATLHKTRQQAFVEPRSKGRVAELEAEVAMRRAEVDHARGELDKTVLRAPQAGVAVVRDRSQWAGRPVMVGERIMLVADPARVRLRLMVPVRDAVALEPGTPLRLFLDVDPLRPRAGQVEQAGYVPETTPEGVVAYPVHAVLSDDGPMPRIGLRGTARVQGEEVTLFYLLMRRPIAVLRQWAGM